MGGLEVMKPSHHRRIWSCWREGLHETMWDQHVGSLEPQFELLDGAKLNDWIHCLCCLNQFELGFLELANERLVYSPCPRGTRPAQWVWLPKGSPGVSPPGRLGEYWKHSWQSATYCGHPLSCWPCPSCHFGPAWLWPLFWLILSLTARNRHLKGQWLKRDKRLFPLYTTFWRGRSTAAVTTGLQQGAPGCAYLRSVHTGPLGQGFVCFLSLFKSPGSVLLMRAVPVFNFNHLCPYFHYFFPST